MFQYQHERQFNFIACDSIFKALLVAKVTAAAVSGSLVILSSMLDSAMDLVSGALMWWRNRAIKKTDIYLYPRGIANALFVYIIDWITTSVRGLQN